MHLLIWFCGFFSLVVYVVCGNVVLISNNFTMSFDAIEANFAPAIKESGECGSLYLAEPLNACSTLANEGESVDGANAQFVLIVRGGCSFEDKVRRAQAAGFRAVIVFDDEDNSLLVAMAGNSAGIKINAVFVSKNTGEMLQKFAGLTDVELWIIPSFENSAWSIMAISFISLLAMSALLATCFFVRRHRIRRGRPQASHMREFHGMSSRLVKTIPSLIFTTVLEDNCTSRTCAICLEDYSVGEKLRILPCNHKFHAFCVDSWLTAWRTFCPVCKRDARTNTRHSPASESTPLLSTPLSTAASSALSSVGSSSRPSSAIQISPASSLSSTRSPSTAPRVHHYFRVNHQSPPSHTSADLQGASYQRFLVGHPSDQSVISPLNSRYISPYLQSPASISYISSSGRQHSSLRCSDSAASFSPFASAQSLPGC